MEGSIPQPAGPPPADPPGPAGIALLRQLAAARRDPLGACLRAFHAHGDLVRYPLRRASIYQVCAPALIQQVLVDRRDLYAKYAHRGSRLEVLFGDSLLTLNGAPWRRRRAIARTAFEPARVAGLAAVVTEEAVAIGERWHAARGAAVDVAESMMEVSLAVLGRAMLGVELGDDGRRLGRAFTRLSRQLFRLPLGYRLARRLVPGLKLPRNAIFEQGLAEVEAVLERIVADRRQRFARGEALGDDFVSALVRARDPETGDALDARQLRDEVVTFFVGGHETAAIALAWTWYLLGRHPEVAARLRDEVDRVLGGRLADAGDLDGLTYTRQVVLESMRLRPPAHSFSRSPTDDDVLGGFRVVAGARMLIQPYVVHRHPEHWPDPERFAPQRFRPQAIKARHPYAYLPFGGGPRICIGRHFAMQEILLVLATLAQRFDLRPTGSAPVAMEPLLTLRPRGGVWMRPIARLPAPGG